ncbi:hypothetical protein L1987_25340 [Smallanthus sonchifolius]|uniref:Uncharacterized protein n=1 Tax=Smallanthus sonchifolius TaxID=185202 RepID=A0ACB9INW8_9ASTR|nr:hypothetical protein L1987_25340 [Smallanthus sonchifolius]
MKIQIGTPPVHVLGIADTGSDLTWAQCEPCKNCYKQVGPPLFVPTSSSTYQAQKCGSKACDQSQFENELTCDSKNNCQYQMLYGDGSYSIGGLATDTFWFGPTPFKHVVFGCGHDNNGTFNGNISGTIGLGWGRLSIINQLNSVTQGKFSYCLISQIEEGSNHASKIHFGDSVNVSGPNVVSTPLLKKSHYNFYYVTLESVLVGNNSLSYKQSFSKSIGGKMVKDPQGILEVCYQDLHLDLVPTVTFRFSGGDVELSPVNMFLEVEEGVSCLSIVSGDEFPIFGNLLQRNMMVGWGGVGFDLVNKKISFKPNDCAMQ